MGAEFPNGWAKIRLISRVLEQLKTSEKSSQLSDGEASMLQQGAIVPSRTPLMLPLTINILGVGGISVNKKWG